MNDKRRVTYHGYDLNSDDPTMLRDVTARVLADPARGGAVITPDEIATLRQLAAAATPGPWYVGYDRYLRSPAVPDDYDNKLHWDAEGLGATWLHDADAAYIAAVDPQTVLGLLAALDRAEAVVAGLRRLMVLEGWQDEEIDVALRAYEDADKVADG